MEYIRYFNEDSGEVLTFDEDQFVREASLDMPFEYVQEQADINPRIRRDLYHKLFKRAKGNYEINRIQESTYYPKLFTEIINGNNTYERILLAVYYDPSLIEFLFQGIENLIDNVVNCNTEGVSYLDLMDVIVSISKYDIDDNIRSKLISGIEVLASKEFNLINSYGEFTSIDSEKTKKELISSYLIRINKEKNK